MTRFTLKVGASGFVLSGVVTGAASEHAAVMCEQPWGRAAAILREHGVTLLDVARCDMAERDEPDPERARVAANG